MSVITREKIQSRKLAHRRVYSVITQRIESGIYSKGDYLPSARILASEFDVSRRTIHLAIALLEEDGIVESWPKRGVHIKGGTEPEQNNASAIYADLGLVALIVPFSEESRIANEYVSGVHDALDERGFHMLLSDTSSPTAFGSLRKERSVIKALIDKKVSGIILYYTGEEFNLDVLREAQETGIPVVLIDRGIPDLAIDVVSIDNENGAYLATKHLIDCGHRRIGHISGPWNISTVSQRFKGYCKALEEHGIPFDQHLVHTHTEDVILSAEMAIAHYLSLRDRPTAIFALSDIQACSAWAAIEKAGLKVPDDISIVGFNNIFSNASVEAGRIDRLTTIDQLFRQTALQATELLLQRIRGLSCTEPQEVLLPAKLVIRESTQSLISTKE